MIQSHPRLKALQWMTNDKPPPSRQKFPRSLMHSYQNLLLFSGLRL